MSHPKRRVQERSSIPGKVRGRGTHHVYVVRLDVTVLQRRKVRRANPGYQEGAPCVYVGMTGNDPRQRFADHMRGHKASRIVMHFGKQLWPEYYEHLNPMPYLAAVDEEVQLAERLRARGWAVWQR